MQNLITNQDIANCCLNQLDMSEFSSPFLKNGQINLIFFRSLRALAITCKRWEDTVSKWHTSKYPAISLTARTLEYRDKLIELAIVNALITTMTSIDIFKIQIKELKIEKFEDLSSFMANTPNLHAYMFSCYFSFSQKLICRTKQLKLTEVQPHHLSALQKTLCDLQKQENISLDPLCKNFQLLESLLKSEAHLEDDLDCYAEDLGSTTLKKQRLEAEPKPNLIQLTPKMQSPESISLGLKIFFVIIGFFAFYLLFRGFNFVTIKQEI